MQLSNKNDFRKLDLATKPGDDFFKFVNGNWIAQNPIPPEESRWGSFDILRLRVEEQLKEILEDIAGEENLAQNSNAQRIRDFYGTAMDTEKLRKLGVKSLERLFALIRNAVNSRDLVSVASELHRLGIGAFWMPFVGQDEKRSEIMALHLYQSGLSLPDRDYYLLDDPKAAAIRETYHNYILAMLVRAGADAESAKKSSEMIFAIETRLARVSRTKTELRNLEKLYNKMTPAELGNNAPAIDWRNYFEAMRTPNMEYLVVCQPEFFSEVSRMFQDTRVEDLKTYLEWHVLNEMSEYLGEEFEQESFNFYDRTFEGATEMKPRWRRVLEDIDEVLGEALGELYVKRHFDEKAKRKIRDLVAHLITAYRSRIKQLDWMGPETKMKALEKLGAISCKLGYPDIWKDFSGLTIGTESYAENHMRACAFEFDRKIRRIGQPVDRNEWFMSPQTVNAYYEPLLNEIVFPAGILQPPFFDPNAPDALNFGGIGQIIGHEITHGFDDQGGLFDLNGNMHNWWQDEDKKRFEEKTAKLAVQFDHYEPFPGEYLNGKLTLGENIADLGGVLIAYDGLMLALKEGEVRNKEGFTPRQLFFIGLAIVWCRNIREEAARTSMKTDVHSPAYYRVNGPLSNLPEFYEAFGCSPGDRLWRPPEDRVKVW